MKFVKIVYILMFLLLVPLVKAASLSISAPDYIVEGDSSDVEFIVTSNPVFDGVAYLTFNNVNSSTTSKSFSTGDFSGQEYSFNLEIDGYLPGEYSIVANVTNSSGATQAYEIFTGDVNSSIPQIVSSSPYGIIDTGSFVLEVRTNEESTCKFETTNKSYDNLVNTFSNVNGIIHNYSITGLGQGSHSYYVKCLDNEGYSMSESYAINFEVDLPPTAEITLSDSNPVKAGTIEVTVITSESLDNAPSLEYSYDDAPTTKKIVSLTGSGSEWKGYIVITENENNKIGTFYFEGIDDAGNEGTKITSGNLFVVDTEKPPSPISVKAIAQPGGDIKLKWYYDGEEVDHFNIYRSTTSGINYVDFYSETETDDDSNTSQQFLDVSTVDKVTYYYRISAIDKAGNEGPLSAEVYGTSVSVVPKTPSSKVEVVEDKEEDIPKVLPPNLVPLVDTSKKQVDKLVLDVEDLINKVEAKQGEERAIVINLKFKQILDNTKIQLENMKNTLDSYKKDYATRDQLEEKLHKIDMEIKKIEATVPKEVKIMEKSDFLQSIAKEDVSIAVDEFFKDLGFTDKEKNQYIKLNNRKKDMINVEVSAKIVNIEFLDGSKRDKTYISKKMSYAEQENLEDVIVIELIPKSIAVSTDEIDFMDQKYEILAEDPIVKFGFMTFDYAGETISYTLDKKINIEEVKNSKTVVLLSLNEMVLSSNKVTGSSIFSFGSLGKTQSLFVWLGLGVIVVLSVYYLFFVKDFKSVLREVNRRYNIFKLKLATRGEDNYQPIPRSTTYSNAPRDDFLKEIHQDIKKMKMDMADRMYPVFNKLHDKIEQNVVTANTEEVKTDDIVYVNNLIDQAHSHIDNNDLSKAVKLYPQINSSYMNLSKDDKGLIYPRCVEVRQKMRN